MAFASNLSNGGPEQSNSHHLLFNGDDDVLDINNAAAAASSSSSTSSTSSGWDLPEPPSIGKALRNFRINGLFCDVALHFTSNSWGGTGKADVPPPLPPLFAHKVVLAACSPYFFSELSSSQSDESGIHHIYLPSDACDKSVQFILSWMYGEADGSDEKKTMTKELAESVAKTAFSFMLTELLNFLGEDGRRWLRSAALTYESFCAAVDREDGLSPLPSPQLPPAEDCVVSMEPVVKTEDEDWTLHGNEVGNRKAWTIYEKEAGNVAKKRTRDSSSKVKGAKVKNGARKGDASIKKRTHSRRPKGGKSKRRKEAEEMEEVVVEEKEEEEEDDNNEKLSNGIEKESKGSKNPRVSHGSNEELDDSMGVDENYDDDDNEDDDDDDEREKSDGQVNNFTCMYTADPVLNACLVMDPSNPADPFGKFVCPKCNFLIVKEEIRAWARSYKKVFYRRAARHLLDHHNVVCPTLAFQCDEPECTHIFLRKSDLQVHIKKLHEGEKTTVNCDQCGKTLNCSSLPYHMRNVHNKEAESRLCGICGKKFKNNILLKIHEKDAHWIGVDPSSVFRCDYNGCDFKTPWKSKFSVHMYMKHQKLLEGTVLYECDICNNYKAPTREQVNKHKKFQHELQRSLPCPQCDQLFKRKCHVEAHFKRVHSADKPVFICSECSHEFATSGALKEHRLREHPADGVKGRKLFRCPYCPHESFLAGNCMKHVRRIHPQFEAKYIDARSDAARRRSQNSVYAIYAEDEGAEDVVLGSMRAAGVLGAALAHGGDVQDLSTAKISYALKPSPV